MSWNLPDERILKPASAPDPEEADGKATTRGSAGGRGRCRSGLWGRMTSASCPLCGAPAAAPTPRRTRAPSPPYQLSKTYELSARVVSDQSGRRQQFKQFHIDSKQPDGHCEVKPRGRPQSARSVRQVMVCDGVAGGSGRRRRPAAALPRADPPAAPQ
ncbi:hypothetical protein EVAR_40329_1 [Eumeta japonica]|uniref:Uncharacterized protein n=1 Tax=Eumeta variegata TaxID=151549 RepID=A0A4C1YA46_EUMVA|nr:hypothetical protein EVAR_40329_1 [Eumeta japonica]